MSGNNVTSPRAHFFGHTLRDRDRIATGIVDVEDIAMRSPMTTHEESHSLNQSVATKAPITLPTTPRKPTPNSAKKRRQMPDLSRPTPTPGHGVKMSMIFRDAADSLQGSGLPSNQNLSNIKRPRLPLSQARETKFGSTCRDETLVLSGLSSPPKIIQHPGEPCGLKRASLEISRQRTSGVGPHYPTSTHLTKAITAASRTITDQCLGTAADVGSMCLDDTLRVSSVSPPSRTEDEGGEPISSGFATPIASTPNYAENPEEVKYPILENWRSLQSRSNASSLGSDNDDLHSTHGIPFILPFPYSDVKEAPRSDINTWLNGVAEAASSRLSCSPKQSFHTEDLLTTEASIAQSIASNLSSLSKERVSPSKLKQDMWCPSRTSSEKENVRPSKYPSSPTRPPAQDLQANPPSRFFQTNTQATLQSSKAPHFAHPLTPSGHLNLPPKVKRACIDGIGPSTAEAETPMAPRDFTIHEHQVAEALAQLSPDVERHRKGRGPRRERCMSYWDEDILQPSSRCVPMDVDSSAGMMTEGKQVLGESKQAVGLTTEKPFAEEVGPASFRFKP